MSNEIATNFPPLDMTRDELVAENVTPSRAPHPAGVYVMRFVDVIDMGFKEYMGKTSHRLAFVLVSNQKVADGEQAGEPVYVRHYCTTSLHPGNDGSSPSKHITMLREVFNRPNMTSADIPTYSTGKMIGLLCKATIVLKRSKAGKDYALIVAFSPAKKSEDNQAIPLSEYRRPDWLRKTDVRAAGPEAAEAKDVFAATATPVETGPNTQPEALPPAAEDADEPPPLTDADEHPHDDGADPVPF